MDLGGWLRRLGLEQYEAAFRENEIDETILPKLTAEDLKDLGVSIVGHRRKLLDAITALRTDGGAEALSANEVSTSWSSGVGPADRAERRQVTIMFSDLVGSTALSARMDPEDLREVISAYQNCVTETVRRFGGFVAKYMGDGVLVYFGYPQAHEDDAERAVRAGLGLVEAVPTLRAGHDAALQVRIGIATGLVVVGDLIGEGAGQEQGVVGETPNVAARLQAFADPGQVVVSQSTRRLTGGMFEYRDLGRVALKGLADPVQAWQVLGSSTVESRFEAQHGSALTPLVGREEELELLLRRWQQAKAGDGSVVLISGEPGIGKSRLAQTLLERLNDESHTRLRSFCSPHHQDTALYPTITQLERAAGFRRDDTDEQRLAKLERLLTQATNELSETVPLLAALLSIPTGEHYPALDLTPQKRKEKTLKALITQVEGLAAHQPVLMVVEDAQWSDPTFLELLDLIVERVSSLPVLLMVTYRPEFTPSWRGRSHVTSLILNRLPRRQRAEMVVRVTGGKTLPREVADQIVDRTDGIPLFIEELTKAVVESGDLADAGDHYTVTRSLPSLAIPTTLHASLLARLDRLAPVREVAQMGAALGRQFSHGLIASIAPMSGPKLEDALERLVRAELIYRRGVPPDAVYTFKHALIQDAAYSTLLRSQRQILHARIGSVLREQFPEIAATEPETLAHHFTQGGLLDLAIDFWHKAGERALRRSALVEAVQHMTHGIELTRSLPPTPGRDRRELDLHLALGRFIRIVKGMAAPETLQAFTRARELLDDGASVTEQMTVLYGLWGVHYVRAEHAEARSVAQQCLDLAAGNKPTNEGAGVLAHYIMGDTLWATGIFTEARYHLERSLQLSAGTSAGTTVTRVLQNHDISALSYLAWALWPLGYPKQATAAAKQAVRRARDTGHVPLIAFVSFADAFLAAALGADRDRREAYFDEVVTYCVEHGVRAYELWTRFCQGIAAARGGDTERGIAVMRRTVEELEAINAELFRPLHLGHLAVARASLGQADAGIALIEEAISTLEKTGERLFEAELYRLRGELWISLGETDEAERALLQGLTVARGQQARMWELRASTSLARLWRDQGKRKEARELLAPVYGWFTEGFDSRDLKEAKTLLEELAA